MKKIQLARKRILFKKKFDKELELGNIEIVECLMKEKDFNIYKVKVFNKETNINTTELFKVFI